MGDCNTYRLESTKGSRTCDGSRLDSRDFLSAASLVSEGNEKEKFSYGRIFYFRVHAPLDALPNHGFGQSRLACTQPRRPVSWM